MSTDYLLEGWLWCQRCQSYRHPAPSVDGGRYYACAPGCDQPPTGADWVEQHATLAAMVHMDGVLRHGQQWRTGTTAEERKRWAQVDQRNHRSVITTAFRLVEIGANGAIRFAWRHRDDPQVAC